MYLEHFLRKFHVKPVVLSTLRKWEAVRMEMAYTMFVYIRDGPNSSFAGHPAILKPDTKFPARYLVDAGYRISGRILDISDIDRATQIIEKSQIFKLE